jgi:predicted metal-dependent enzyme (double-stranded beta helix superfamily)
MPAEVLRDFSSVESKFTGADLSMLSMEAGADFANQRKMSFDGALEKIDSVQRLVAGIDAIFKQRSPNWSITKTALISLLTSVDLSTDEVNKFTFWDSEKPYTRNLISTDNLNYTLLLLCWNPGKESKIHNHPCDGCFVKTIRGCIREARYTIHDTTNEIRLDRTRFFNEGQVIITIISIPMTYLQLRR